MAMSNDFEPFDPELDSSFGIVFSKVKFLAIFWAIFRETSNILIEE